MTNHDDVNEVAYVDCCPGCGTSFVGMTPDEFREHHGRYECPHAPFTALLVFPVDSTSPYDEPA